MPYGILSAFFSVALFTLGGCVGAIEKGDMAKALEVTLATYTVMSLPTNAGRPRGTSTTYGSSAMR